MKRLLGAIVVLLMMVATSVSTASPAAAAGRLKVSSPANHDELSERPGWVSLAFDTTIKRSLLKVLVVDAQGRNMVAGDLIYQGSAVLVQLDNDLPQGTYTVKYQVDRKDGQPEGGAFQFAYGKGSWTPVLASWSGKAQQPPEMANPDPMATGPVSVPSSTPPVVEVSDEPTDATSASPTDSAGTPSGTATPGTPAGTPSAAPSEPGGANSPMLWVVGAVVVVAAAGGLGWWLIRRRRG